MSTTIKPGINGMRPVHPGEVLREEFLRPLEMSVVALAGALRMTPSQIDELIQERGPVTADTALRLARYFGGDAKFWLNLQHSFDLKIAESALRPQLADIVPLQRDR